MDELLQSHTNKLPSPSSSKASLSERRPPTSANLHKTSIGLPANVPQDLYRSYKSLLFTAGGINLCICELLQYIAAPKIVFQSVSKVIKFPNLIKFCNVMFPFFVEQPMHKLGFCDGSVSRKSMYPAIDSSICSFAAISLYTSSKPPPYEPNPAKSRGGGFTGP